MTSSPRSSATGTDPAAEPAAELTDAELTDDELADDELAGDEHALDPAMGKRPIGRTMPWLLAVGGFIAFLASFALTYERFQLLVDEDHEVSCDFGGILSCGSVMTTPQASAFGFPNPLIGIASFAAVTMLGAGLLAGANYRRWFWLGLQAGTVFGIGFVIWLMYQSMFVINRLCPYCMVVWAVMIPLFWYTTLYNLDRRHLPVPAGGQEVVATIVRNRGALLVLLYLVPALLMLLAFRTHVSALF